MVYPVDERKVVGSTVHAKAINLIAEDECQILYGSHKNVNIAEGVVVAVDQQINKQRRNKCYVISDYKNPDGSVKSVRLHIKSVVAGPVLVPVPVNLPAIASLLTATTTIIIPFNPSTSVPADHYTPVDPSPVPTTTTTNIATALLPTTTNVPSNFHNIFAPAPDPTIATTVPSNPPTTFVPEPDTTTTTCIYTNTHN